MSHNMSKNTTFEYDKFLVVHMGKMYPKMLLSMYDKLLEVNVTCIVVIKY